MLSAVWNVACETLNLNKGGTLFQMSGLQIEKARMPNWVQNSVKAALCMSTKLATTHTD